MQRITDAFFAANIRPSYLPISDKQINGSPYFRYRHELSSRDNFSVPEGFEDPYIAINLIGKDGIFTKEYHADLVAEEGIGIENENIDNYVDPEPSCCGCNCSCVIL